MKLYDLAMTEERDGSYMMHAANCPHARKLADDGYPVMTMFECQGIPDMLPKHSCLTPPENAEAARSAAG